MKKLKVALLGQGRSGYAIHGRHLLRDTERFEVAYAVDKLPERREKAARVFGCETFDDYTALFGKEIDLVVNALPTPWHHPVTIDLLNHGFNVLCEKPATRSPEMLDEMQAAAEKNGRMLAIFQQSRFAPYFVKVKDVLSSGVLGRPVQISIAFNGYARRWDWQCLQDNIAGALYNTGPHPLDQALDLLGGEDMPNIFCKMDNANVFGDAEDYVKLILTMPDRPLIDLEISSCDGYPWGTYKIEGTRGALCGTQKELHWKWFVEAEAPEHHQINAPLTTEAGEPAYCGEKLNWHEESWVAGDGEDAFVDAVRTYYTMIYEHLTENKPLRVTVKQVRRQLAVIEEAHRQNPMPKWPDAGMKR